MAQLQDFIADPFPASEAPRPPAVAVTELAPWRYANHDGDKFPGGFGYTEILLTDYWTLRERSAQLFEQNLYARGLIRRLVTNEINVGLHLDATPEEAILGFERDELEEWTETTENRFSLWARNPWLCDQTETRTFGQMQALARQEALVVGDVLCVMRQDPRTQLPRLHLINGATVRTPLGVEARTKNKVCHGVEIDGMGRHLAYWVMQDDGTSKRLPAWGEKSGRRLAWLIYGTDKRIDDVRGKPLLSLVLQSLKELDRYRDSTQRKALVLSMLALFIKKNEAVTGSSPLSGGAVRRTNQAMPATASTGEPRTFTTAQHMPGLVIDELAHGEEPAAFQTNGTVESYGDFEEAIVQAIAWANEIPPEILTLAFSSNYSASQAAINEFKIYLNRFRTNYGSDFCQPVYVEWLLAEVTARRLKAPGLIEAWADPAQYDTAAAWTSADWSGNIKPAVDLSKLIAGYDAAVAGGYITRDRAARELFGTKFTKNVQTLARENEMLAEANEPIAELKAMEKAARSDAGGAAAPTEGDATDEGSDDDVATETGSGAGDEGGTSARISADARGARALRRSDARSLRLAP